MGYEWIDEMFRFSMSKEDLEELEATLKDMREPVEVYTFVDNACRYCSNTVRLIETLSNVSPKIGGSSLVRHRVVKREADAEGFFKKFNVSRVPTVLMIEGHIKYTGMPAGEEIRGLIETLIRLSTGDSGLNEHTVREITGLKAPVKIDVIVTPTCPYCPYAALLANMFAFESFRSGNKLVTADIIEAYENPDIADKYGVMSVPTIAINGEVEFIGVPYEDQLLERVLEHSKREYLKKVKKEEYMRILRELTEDKES
ncbi:MAG: thioredoxin family protein [Desulfurococcaceae archaeon]|jgi:glutaredoxin-like protein|nr:thioredoxin family protein [Desulfurococcaceae archaeon]